MSAKSIEQQAGSREPKRGSGTTHRCLKKYLDTLNT